MTANYDIMGLDSVELIIDVEKHFSISIPDRDAEKASTVGQLVDCVSNILNIKNYDFSLRENTFGLIKSHILKLDPNLPDFTIQSRVAGIFDITDIEFLKDLESKCGLHIIGIRSQKANNTWNKISRWLLEEDIDFEKITWKKYIDILLSANLEKAVMPLGYNSKFEIYLAIMRITVDKIGVNYREIGIEKSFTDDLGVD